MNECFFGGASLPGVVGKEREVCYFSCGVSGGVGLGGEVGSDLTAERGLLLLELWPRPLLTQGRDSKPWVYEAQ